MLAAEPVTTASRRDYVALMQAAYQIQADEQAWLGGLARAARPLIDSGFGVMAWAFEYVPTGIRVEVKQAVLLETDRRIWEAFLRSAEMAEPSHIRRYYDAPACSSMSRALGGGRRFLAQADIKEHLHPLGVLDFNIVRCSGPEPRGLVLAAPSSRLTAFPPRKSQVLAQVAAHVSTAARLRRRLMPGSRERAPTEAVLNTAGRVLHAEGLAKPRSARASLASAARDVTTSLDRLRNSRPEAAVDLWRALVDGRWSLVFQYDSDGRRYLLARRNDPRVASPRALNVRERQVAALAGLARPNKLIAYELGLSESMVAENLRSALTKLGLRSRAELVRFAGRAEPDAPRT
jgi:DNA-binding CsgD family transcriptional regulator